MKAILTYIRKRLAGSKDLDPSPSLIMQDLIQEPGLLSRQEVRLEGQPLTLRLRLGQVADAPALEALERQAYDGYLAWRQEDFYQDLTQNPYSGYLVWVSEDSWGQDQVWALICGRFGARKSHISQLMVHPKLQGQGLGSQLLAQWLRICRHYQIPQVQLEIRETNVRAQAFYQQFGFQVYDVVPGYYSDNQENALRMRCDLRRELENGA